MSLLEPISQKQLLYRLLVIGVAISNPILCMIFYGILPSLSTYWNTGMQPLFILTNLFTAYYFFQLKRWELPALFLVLLTSFSVEYYLTLHDIFAVAFFISVIYPLYTIHHHKWVIWVYISTIVIIPFSLLFFEIAMILIICMYHGLVMYKVNKLKS